MNRNEHMVYGALAVSTAFFLGTMFFVGPSLFAQTVSQTAADAQVAAAAHVLAPDVFTAIDTTAQAAAVFDVTNNQMVYAKNADTPLALASVTKALSAVVLATMLQQIPEVTITPEALITDGESGLVPFDTWGTEDLLSFSLVTSSNDGMEALRIAADAHTDESAIANMNAYAKAQGFDTLQFESVTGLDVEDTYGVAQAPTAIGSARDVARMFAQVVQAYPHLFEATARAQASYTSKGGVLYTADNTNVGRGSIPGLAASKTGFTDIAGGNLVVLFEPEPGRQFVVVVLGSTITERFTDVHTLVDATLEHLWFKSL